MTVTLNKRWGGIVKAPKERDLMAAFAELRTKDPEHAECWLSDHDGWTITAYENGRLLFDNVETGDGPWHLPAASMSKALALSRLLIAGDLEKIRSEAWIDGYGDDRSKDQQGLIDDLKDGSQANEVLTAKRAGAAGTRLTVNTARRGFLALIYIGCVAYALWNGISGLVDGEVRVFNKHGDDWWAPRTTRPGMYWTFVVTWFVVAVAGIWYGIDRWRRRPATR